MGKYPGSSMGPVSSQGSSSKGGRGSESEDAGRMEGCASQREDGLGVRERGCPEKLPQKEPALLTP